MKFIQKESIMATAKKTTETKKVSKPVTKVAKKETKATTTATKKTVAKATTAKKTTTTKVATPKTTTKPTSKVSSTKCKPALGAAEPKSTKKSKTALNKKVTLTVSREELSVLVDRLTEALNGDDEGDKGKAAVVLLIADLLGLLNATTK